MQDFEDNDVMAQLAAIVTSAQTAVIGEDGEGIITSWNQGAQMLFGYDSLEAIGQPGTILIPDELRDLERDMLLRIRNGQQVARLDTVGRHKDRQLVDVSVRVSPIKDTNGQIVGMSKIARDITRKKWFDEAQGRSKAAKEKLGTLNPREREILEQVVAGNANKVIARKLSLSEKTIEKHRARVMSKLNARSLAELVRIALPAVG